MKNNDNYSILIVDDEPDIREILHIYFEKDGRTLFEAEDGAVALEVLEKENIDIVITDIMMPNINGLELCEKISQKWPNIVMLVLTAHGGKNEIMKALQSGVHDFLDKPVTQDIASNRMDNAIEHAGYLRSELNLLTVLSDSLNVGAGVDFAKLSTVKRTEYLKMLTGLASMRIVRADNSKEKTS